MFQARLHRHIPGRCSLESRTLRHQRSSFESPTYFSLFYGGSREAIVNRITFVSSTSKAIGIRHQKWCRSSFISGFCLLNPANSTPSSVTECHADDGRRIADRYSQRQRPVWLSRSPAADQQRLTHTGGQIHDLQRDWIDDVACRAPLGGEFAPMHGKMRDRVGVRRWREAASR